MRTRPDILHVLGARPAAADPTDVALEDSDRCVSYGSLAARVTVLADALARQGVQAGDRVAVALPNSAASVEMFLACAALGAIWVGINPSAPVAEASRQLDLVTPRLVVGTFGVDVETLVAGEVVRGELPPTPDPEVPCAIAFTSGTTGPPKAIVHSRSGLSLVAQSMAATTVKGTDRVGVTLPLSILNVMIVGPLTALLAGATAVVLDRMNARGVASVCHDRRLTMVRALVPATVYDLVHDDEIAPDSLSSLREAGTGAAGLAESLRGAFEMKFGVRLVGSYGLSEAPAAVCFEDAARDRRPGSSGVPLPHVSISVRDPAGRPVPTGVVGEVWVGPATGGPWAAMYRPALGTWVDGALSLAERNDNCFPTGDLGSIDRDGALHVDARRSDVITRGGVTINAAELETTLSGMAGVREVSVIGQRDARLGERIVAFVEMQNRRTRDPSSLKDEAAGLLSHGKLPDEFVIVDALPRNAMGKVARPELVAYIAQDGMRE